MVHPTVRHSAVAADDVPVLAHPARGFLVRQPAARWEDGLIVGSGRVGAMVYGEPEDETVILTRAGLFMPWRIPLQPPDTASQLPEIRRLLAAGQWQDAADRVVEIAEDEGWTGKRWTDPLIPACDLRLAMPSSGAIRRYARGVDFATGVAHVGWEDNRGAYHRRVFSSRADAVTVVVIEGPGAGAVSCRLRLAIRPRIGQGGWQPQAFYRQGISQVDVTPEPGLLTYRSTFRRTWRGSIQGYEVTARVVATGGSSRIEGDALAISAADRIVVTILVEPIHEARQRDLNGHLDRLAALPADPEELLARHAALHGEMFNRARLDLDGGDGHRTPAELLAEAALGEPPPALIERQFDAARYAAICATGELPPALPGMWTGTWGSPWSGDFTHSGNLQTALAGFHPTGLPELMLPYFAYLESQLADYRLNARRLFGCRGIHIPSRTSTHGLNNHFDGICPMTFWTAGAAWAGRFFWDHWQYTRDVRFLRQRVWPFLCEAAAFYEDFLVPGADGRLTFSPSHSPENHPGNSASQACVDATMDLAAARELLLSCLAAAAELRLDDTATDGRINRWRDLLARLPPYRVAPSGALAEWLHPGLSDRDEHRHASHLYALFHELPSDIASDPMLLAACRRALDRRLSHRRSEPTGEKAIGVVQLAQAAISLGERDMAWELFATLSRCYWSPVLTTTRDAGKMFNIDLCGGFPHLVARFLVDGTPGRVHLLPCLPRSWPSGRVEGLCVRGGLTVRRLTWDAQRIEAVLEAGAEGSVEVTAPGAVAQTLHLLRGKPDCVAFHRVSSG